MSTSISPETLTKALAQRNWRIIYNVLSMDNFRQSAGRLEKPANEGERRCRQEGGARGWD